jgi:hypothetical protein
MAGHHCRFHTNEVIKRLEILKGPMKLIMFGQNALPPLQISCKRLTLIARRCLRHSGRSSYHSVIVQLPSGSFE